MPKTCPQCQTEAADAATFCPNCGAALSGAAGAAAPPSAPPPPPPGPGPAGPPTGTPTGTPTAPSSTSGLNLPPYRFNVARWSTADWIAGGATVVLFISLFLPWFTASLGFFSVSVNGLWHGWMYLTLILCILVVAYLLMRAGWDRLPISQEVPHLTVMLVATGVNAVLVLIAFIDKPGGGATGWGAGAVLGLIAAIVAVAPYAIPPLRERTM